MAVWRATTGGLLRSELQMRGERTGACNGVLATA